MISPSWSGVASVHVPADWNPVFYHHHHHLPPPWPLMLAVSAINDDGGVDDNSGKVFSNHQSSVQLGV